MAKYRVSIKYKTKISKLYTDTHVIKEAESKEKAISLAVNDFLKRTNVVEAHAYDVSPV